MKRYTGKTKIWLIMIAVFIAAFQMTGAAVAQTETPPLKVKVVFNKQIYYLDDPNETITVNLLVQNTTGLPIWTIKGFDSFHTYLYFYGPLDGDPKQITSKSIAIGGSPAPTPSVAPDDVEVEQLDADWTNNAIKITLEEAREIYSLTQPGRYRVWFSMSFVQYDSAQIFIEDRNNDGVPENYAPFDATVYKGVIEYYEEYITLTTNEPAGVTSDVRVTVTEHIFGEGPKPGVTKVPFVDPGFKLRLYRRSACEEKYHPINHTTCGAIVQDPILTANALTAELNDPATGEYIFKDVPQDDWVVIGYAGPGTDYKHLWSPIDAVDDRWGQDISMKLKLMTDYRGKKSPGKAKKVTGSELWIIEPEYVEWTSTEEMYPFAFESDDDWGVEVAIEPPEGFVADNESLTETVSSEMEALQFTINDVGSKYEATKVKYKLKHKGKVQKIDSKIYIKLTRKLAKEKKVPIWGEDLEKSKPPKKK